MDFDLDVLAGAGSFEAGGYRYDLGVEQNLFGLVRRDVQRGWLESFDTVRVVPLGNESFLAERGEVIWILVARPEGYRVFASYDRTDGGP